MMLTLEVVKVLCSDSHGKLFAKFQYLHQVQSYKQYQKLDPELKLSPIQFPKEDGKTITIRNSSKDGKQLRL